MKTNMTIATTTVIEAIGSTIARITGAMPARCHAHRIPIAPSSVLARKSVWCVGLSGASVWFSEP